MSIVVMDVMDSNQLSILQRADIVGVSFLTMVIKFTFILNWPLCEKRRHMESFKKMIKTAMIPN